MSQDVAQTGRKVGKLKGVGIGHLGKRSGQGGPYLGLGAEKLRAILKQLLQGDDKGHTMFRKQLLTCSNAWCCPR